MRSKKGFTLLEVLLVVAAIGILAGIVIIAVNPGKQLGDTRNAERKVDVNTILNAVYQYSLDNNGSLPASIGSTGPCSVGTNEICRSGGACTSLIDLSVLTDAEKYIVAIPVDPSKGATGGAGYNVVKTVNNRITVCAPLAEQNAVISATR